MPSPDRSCVLRAMSPSKWDASNRVLYDLCREHPAHTDDGEVLAKILLIGRAYAAAIERRRTKTDDHDNDRFYFETVAPAIRASSIDKWLHRARTTIPGTPEGLSVMIEVHGRTTRLFGEISQLQKRALASKYLHFHVPTLFFIYDSRAVKAMPKFSRAVPRAGRIDGAADNKYRRFAEECVALVNYCEKESGLHLLPRHVDNLLLRVNER